MHEYTFVYSVDLGKAISEVGSLIESVNDTLAACGHREQMQCRTEICGVTVRLPSPLGHEKEKELGDMIMEELRDKFPELDIRFDGIRGKSVKPCSEPVSL